MPQDNQAQYHKMAHATYDCRYHIVWITKYRFKVLDTEIATALKWSIKHTCDWKDIEILSGTVGEEHVHLYLQIPPKYSISDVMQWIKGKSSEELLKKFSKLSKQYWGRHLWARGYFVSTIGISDEAIKKYIDDQRQVDDHDFLNKWEDTQGEARYLTNSTGEAGV